MKKGYWILHMALIVMMAVSVCISTKPALADGFDTEVKESVAVATTCFRMTAGGEKTLGWGSCFFVGKKGEPVQYLVTNHHVVDTFLKGGGGGETTELVQDGVAVKGKWIVRVYYDSSDYDEAYIVDYDEKKDIALLKLDNPTDKRTALTLCSPTNEMVGSSVYGVGYPGLSENTFADATTSWGTDDVSVTSGTISRLMTTSGIGVRMIQTDTVIQQGNSGGPLVNQNGSAVGINAAALSSTSLETLYSETNYYAINIDELLPMLKMHDVDYSMEGEATESGDSIAVKPVESSDSSGSGSNTVLIVAVVAAVFLVIAVVIVVILMVVKKKSAAAGGTSSQDRMVTQPAQPQLGAQPQMGLGQRSPVVFSMAVQHSGARFSLEGKQILLGRDATSCNIVFRQDTPGVSGRHCSLSYDSAAGDFLLTDLRSTYGTFLANGQRLAPGVPFRLQPGQQFYLGESGNMLRVELE